MVRCDVCGATGTQKTVDREDWEDWEKLEQTAAAADCITAWNLRCLSTDIETLIDERIEQALQAAGTVLEQETDKETAAG